MLASTPAYATHFPMDGRENREKTDAMCAVSVTMKSVRFNDSQLPLSPPLSLSFLFPVHNPTPKD